MKRICVFCGSNAGNRPVYAAAARELGTALAGRGLGLVFGGRNGGLMAAVADAALAGGGTVIGVIPQALAALEVAHGGLTELRVVGSMHERKALMADLADAFIALPGGFGTLDETFEALTWAMLGIQRKPVGLLNVDGYYDGLLAFLDHAVREGFVGHDDRASLVTATAPDALLAALARPVLT